MQKAGLIAALFMLALAGCGVAWFPEPDPNAPTSVTLSASPTSPVAGAPVTITAILKKSDGTAVADGTPVSFTVTATWTGTVAGSVSVNPSPATTTGGTATTTLNASAASTVIVSASAGTVSNQVSVIFASTVTVAASQQIISSITGGTLTITATVKDTAGNLVANGTQVNFTTTVGTLSPLSAQTTSGVATVILTVPGGAAFNGSSIIITATENGTNNSGTATVLVTL